MAVGVGRAARRDDGEPGVEVPGRDAAEHGVDVAGDPGAADRLGEVDRGRDGGVGADPGAEQLVRAEAQHEQHRRVELFQRAVAARGEHGVVAALAAQGAVGQLGREGGVAAGQPALGEQPRQQQVGVGLALVHGGEHVVGGAARIGAPRRLRPPGGSRAVCRACPASSRAFRPGPAFLRHRSPSVARPPNSSHGLGSAGYALPADRNHRSVTATTARGAARLLRRPPVGGKWGGEALPCSGGFPGGSSPRGKYREALPCSGAVPGGRPQDTSCPVGGGHAALARRLDVAEADRVVPVPA